ncbi:MAG: PAS domain S-box protein [bacterium]
MSAASSEILWPFIVATVTLFILGIGIIAIIVVNHQKIIRTQREKLEAIRRSEQNYTDLFNNVSDLVYVHSLDGQLLQINQAVTKQLGYEAKEVVGKSLKTLFPAELDKAIDEYLEDIKPNGETEGLMTILSKTGRPCIFEYRNSMMSKNGRAIAVRGIARNVTEQKETEKALQKSELRFRDLFDNAPDIYIILDPNGNILDFNQRGLLQLGYQANEIIGKPVTEIVHSEDRAKAADMVSQIHLMGKPPKNAEIRLLNKKNEPVWVSEEFSLLKNEDGSIQVIRVVCRNITERKQLQNELARAQRLESAGRVASQIAHDFNNLLAPLAAYPPLIREDLPPDHPILGMIEEMEFAAKKIAEINQQLLSLGRRGHYTMEPIDLNELFQKVLASVSIPEEVKVELDLEPNLLKINGGAAQITRVLTNLIANGKEAMHGMGVLTVKTENVYLEEPLHGDQTVEPGEYVKLEVSDTGTGIAPEIVDKIFDPFFSTKKMDRMRGTGLGLSIVHGVVEDHKGYITVSTKLGMGTSFFLYFPATRDMEDQAMGIDRMSLRGNEKILVVDDDPVQRRVVHHLLNRFGYQVQSVASGERAIEFLRNHPQDLLILDMVMDGIDGTETYRQILAFRPGQKAIITSGYAKSRRVQEALRLGAGKFISKPISPEDLAKAVRKELDQA